MSKSIERNYINEAIARFQSAGGQITQLQTSAKKKPAYTIKQWQALIRGESIIHNHSTTHIANVQPAPHAATA